MKLFVLSDLHLEYGRLELQDDAVDAADVIVLAGDIHLHEKTMESTQQIKYFNVGWDVSHGLLCL